MRRLMRDKKAEGYLWMIAILVIIVVVVAIVVWKWPQLFGDALKDLGDTAISVSTFSTSCGTAASLGNNLELTKKQSIDGLDSGQLTALCAKFDEAKATPPTIDCATIGTAEIKGTLKGSIATINAKNTDDEIIVSLSCEQMKEAGLVSY